MDSRRASIVTVALAVIGMILLAFEGVRAVRGDVLGGLGTALVFIGLSAVIVSGALTIAQLTAADATTGPTEPAPEASEALVESDS